MRPAAGAVRGPLKLFRWAAGLLPPAFRAAYLTDAARDLEDVLADRLARRGRVAAWMAGLAAVLDVLQRVPRERWAARGARGGTARRSEPRTGEAMMNAWNEIRLAARNLVRRPGYAAAAVLTLSLGVGGAVATFTVVNAVLLRPLPYPDADRIVSIRHHAPGLDLPVLENSPGTLRFYRDEAPFFEALAGYDVRLRNLVGGPTPERVQVTEAAPEIFEVLGVQPLLGRAFVAADARPDAPPVAVLTHATWVSRFGRDPDVLGSTVRLDGAVTEIVGVMPEGFAFPDPEPVALLPMYVDPAGPFGQFGPNAVARIPAGWTAESAELRAVELQARLPEYLGDDFPGPGFFEQAGWSVSVRRLQDVLVGDELAAALWVVLATVGFVLLIACANVANLFLVRAESRQRELAIRSAMGAGRARLAASFLAEALVLGAAGGAGGVLLAWSGVELMAGRAPIELPRIHEVAVDWTSLAFAAAVSLAAGLLFGLVSLARHAGTGVAAGLHEGGRGATAGREGHRTRNVLVAAQLALALVLLVGSGLMLRSFHALRSVDLGFEPEGVLTVGLSVGEGVEGAAAARFYDDVASQVAALPGVESVGLSTLVPVAGGNANGGSFYIESKPREEGALPPVAMYKGIGAEYLEAVRQTLEEGRALTRADWEGGAPVALVNRTFADRFLGGDAVGEGIKWDENAEFARVVGVVDDARELGLADESGAFAYLPMVVGDWGAPEMARMSLLIRSLPGRTVPVEAVRGIVERLNPSVPITDVRTMSEAIADDLAQTSFTMVLLGIAAGVALFLGAVGLFGVISYVVSRRTKEIGVRLALGARAEDVAGMVLRQGAAVAAVGTAVGLVAAALLTRLMSSVLYEVTPIDPLTFVAGPVVLVTVAVLATWLPARRASRVDPVEALRAE